MAQVSLYLYLVHVLCVILDNNLSSLRELVRAAEGAVVAIPRQGLGPAYAAHVRSRFEQPRLSQPQPSAGGASGVHVRHRRSSATKVMRLIFGSHLVLVLLPRW